VSDGESSVPATHRQGEDAPESPRLEEVDAKGHRTVGQEQRSTVGRAPEGVGRRQVGANAASDGDHLGIRPPPRVPREGQVASKELLAAFEAGDPQRAYAAAVRLIEAHSKLELEAARLRFSINFGTSVCDHCEGLKAGPGVAATCFQVKRCNYGNVKDDDLTLKQLKVLGALDSA